MFYTHVLLTQIQQPHAEAAFGKTYSNRLTRDSLFFTLQPMESISNRRSSE